MNHEILYQPSYALLKIRLSKGEAVMAEAGAMVSKSAGINIQTSAKGGVMGMLKRGLGGESFFVNTFTAEQEGEITFAPPLPGDMAAVELTGQGIFASSGAYVASSPSVEVSSKWGGVKSFFAGEGLILLKITGSGTVFLSSYGAIHEVTLAAGQTYVVDTGHIVAFDESAQYKVTRVGGLKSTLLSGEGLVCEFTGPGRVLIQSRNAGALISWVATRLPKRG